MEKVFRKNFWWVVSLLLFLGMVQSCCSRKEATAPAQAIPEMPKPGKENPAQVDSLKKAIDLQRQQKRKGQ